MNPSSKPYGIFRVLAGPFQTKNQGHITRSDIDLGFFFENRSPKFSNYSDNSLRTGSS